MSDKTVTVRRVARKSHLCDNDYAHGGWRINPGEPYLVHTSFPGHDSGYATQAGHPVKFLECRECAERRGRPVDADAVSLSAGSATNRGRGGRMKSNFKKALSAAAIAAMLAAGAVGAAQSTNVDDAKANGLRVAQRANGL